MCFFCFLFAFSFKSRMRAKCIKAFRHPEVCLDNNLSYAFIAFFLISCDFLILVRLTWIHATGQLENDKLVSIVFTSWLHPQVELLRAQRIVSSLLNSCLIIESTIKINVKQKVTVIEIGMQIKGCQQIIYCFIKFSDFAYLEVTRSSKMSFIYSFIHL